MALEIVIIPCRRDNYAYLLRDGAGRQVGVIDAPEAAPIAAALEERGWDLNMILITHHHEDHIAGAEALREQFGATLVGAAADAHRLPPLDIALEDGDTIPLGISMAEVIDVPGHTIGHIAYYFAGAQALFSADSLMVMGCGRLFEGSPDQMWASLSRMAALPPETLVHSGHEYAESNLRFALSLDPDNIALQERAVEIARLRAAGRPSVPARLDLEAATNPFLRASDPGLKARLGMPNLPDAQVFAEIRRRKDAY
jgi:hydroxyacylglutathione hydrolase